MPFQEQQTCMLKSQTGVLVPQCRHVFSGPNQDSSSWLGCLHPCRQDSTFEGKTTFSTSTLVGKRDEPLLTIAARQLVEHAHSKGFTK